MTTTPTLWKSASIPYASSTGNDGFSKVVGLENGEFLVVWSHNDGPNTPWSIKTQRFTAEGAKVAPQLHIPSDVQITVSQCLALADGGYVLTYPSFNAQGVTDSIIIERYDSSGVKAFSTALTRTSTETFYSDVSLALNDDGDYMITFIRANPFGRSARGIIFDGITNTATPEFEAGDNSAASNKNPSVTALTNGNFLTSYTLEVGADIHIKIVSPSGVEVVPPIDVTSSGSEGNVAALSGGSFVVVWNSNDNIKFRLGTSQGVLVPFTSTVADGANEQRTPQAIGLKDGGFYVVWADETDHQLLGQRYDALGNLVGTELVIAQKFSHYDHGMALTSDGRILISYNDNNQDVRYVIVDPRDTTITGTEASETITTQVSDTQLYGKGGDDLLLGQQGNDSIEGGNGIDVVRGGKGDDRLDGGQEIDTVKGSAGNDVIYVKEGDLGDQISGGGGIDTLDLTRVKTHFSSVNLATGTWMLGPSFGGGLLLSGIEVVKGTQTFDWLTGGAGDDMLKGGAGYDRIEGGGGADNLNGGTGLDQVIYSHDFSGVHVDLATGLATGGEAEGDTVVGFSDILGGSGNDTLIGDDGGNVIEGGAGDDRLEGAGEGDWVRGNDGNDTIVGGAGDDGLDGDAGDDVIFGGTGDDAIGDTSGNDVIKGGAGHDELRYSSAVSALTVDLMITSAQNTGGAGVDVIVGFEDLIAGQGDDKLSGTNSFNRLWGGSGNDTLDGRDGDDQLNGGLGSDIIVGGNGNDTIVGAQDDDDMTGGAGKDVFVYNSIAETAVGSLRDRISDFVSGTDKIDLSVIDADITVAFDNPFVFLGSAAFSHTPGQLRSENAGGTTVVSGDVDGDGVADFEIEFAGIIVMSEGDFVL